MRTKNQKRSYRTAKPVYLRPPPNIINKAANQRCAKIILTDLLTSGVDLRGDPEIIIIILLPGEATLGSSFYWKRRIRNGRCCDVAVRRYQTQTQLADGGTATEEW
jgi:hypothetical protein